MNANYVSVTLLDIAADKKESNTILAFIPCDTRLLSASKIRANQQPQWSSQSGVEVNLNKWWWMLQRRVSVLTVIKVEILGAVGALTVGHKLSVYVQGLAKFSQKQ